MLKTGKFAAITFLSLGLVWGLASCGSDKTKSTVFEVNIENNSSNNLGYISALVNGVFVVHSADAPAYTVGQAARNNGLEAYAEDANAQKLIDSLGQDDKVTLTGIVDSSRAGEQGVLLPGKNFRFVIAASDKQDRLTALFKFLESNDVFLGTNSSGVPLFDAAGNPQTGDITSEFTFFDAGTEVNEQPGRGANQPSRQGAENTGTAETGTVSPVNDGFSYPPASNFRVTLNVLDEVES